MTGLSESMVRMGEIQVSARPQQVLVAIGLGSCVGLALVDRSRSLAGLAHIVLPEAGRPGADTAAGKFADRAVPLLVEGLLDLGAARASLEAAVVGGGRMFPLDTASCLDIGARNERATRAALAEARIPVRASDTAGCRGRTVRVLVAGGVVTVREAGGVERTILGEREGGA